MAPGAMVDQAMSSGRIGAWYITTNAFKEWKFDDLESDLDARDVKDLPFYPYRDDAQEYRDALEQFVGGIVNVYYASDDAILNDVELQSWCAEIYSK